MAAQISQQFRKPFAAVLLGSWIGGAVLPASAEVTFDFENANPLSSPYVGGNVLNFAATGEQIHGGAKSLKFVDTTPVSYTHLTLPTTTLCRSRWSPYH